MKISSRQSALAQIQAYQVGQTLRAEHSEIEVNYHFRESLGDKNLTDPLWKMPEKGVFTEDFFQDLIARQTDLVVHSWKDLPTETKKDTCIAATLPRADQRDLLLFKKSSMKKPDLRIFSSSPRRAHNLKPFLSSVLPWKIESLEFESVRGNIPTRVRKLLGEGKIDGLILAKAALDRLLNVELLQEGQKFSETTATLRESLNQLDWMVLPLTENPNAAAQGALALEVARNREDILSLVEVINCKSSFKCAQRERDLLQAYGGGCHLALGMSVLERPYGRIEIVRGVTAKGQEIKSLQFFPKKPRPKNLKKGRVAFQVERTSLAVPSQSCEAVYISKAEAYTSQIQASTVWAAGVVTWKKLADLGVWVHGCSEGLGENEEPRIENLLGQKPKWHRLTHDQAQEGGDKSQIASYKINLKPSGSLSEDVDTCVWKSALEFTEAQKYFPNLKNRWHICGPGRTYEVLKKALGSDQNIFVELGDEFDTVI